MSYSCRAVPGTRTGTSTTVQVHDVCDWPIQELQLYRQHLVGRLYCWLLLATAAYCWLRLALQRAARQVDRTDMRVGRR